MAMKLVKKIRQNTAGTRRQTVGTFSGPVLYAAGGDLNNVSELSFGSIREADFVRIGLSNSGTYIAHPVYASDGGVKTVKFLILVVATGAEAGAIDLSAQKFRITVQGN